MSAEARREATAGAPGSPGSAAAARAPAARPRVALRPATARDCRAVWRWRNDEQTRRASFDSSFIEYEAHRRWFLDSLERPDRTMCIVVEGGEPCGVVRLDVSAGDGTVSIFLDRGRQGRGIGPSALDAAAELAERELRLGRLFALIKPDNHASIAAFRRAGFTPSPAADLQPPTALTMVRVLGRGVR